MDDCDKTAVEDLCSGQAPNGGAKRAGCPEHVAGSTVESSRYSAFDISARLIANVMGCGTTESQRGCFEFKKCFNWVLIGLIRTIDVKTQYNFPTYWASIEDVALLVRPPVQEPVGRRKCGSASVNEGTSRDNGLPLNGKTIGFSRKYEQINEGKSKSSRTSGATIAR